MIMRLVASTILVVGLSQAVLAQDNQSEPTPGTPSFPTTSQPQTPNAQPAPSPQSQNTNGQSSAGTSQSQNNQPISAQLRQTLGEAGYTDLTVVPGSFIVTGKDKQGREVMMRFTPNSVMMLTETPMENNSTTGRSTSSSSQR